MEKIKLGIIGLQKAQVDRFNFLSRHFSNIELIAAHARSNSDLIFAKNEIGFQYLYDDSKKLADNNDIDAVLIWSDAKDHAKNAIDAIESNKHVFVDLPFATNKDDGQSLMDAVKRRPSQICYCPFKYMHNPIFKLANDLIKAGEIGTPFMLQANIQGPSNAADRTVDQKDIFSGQALESIAVAQTLMGKSFSSVHAKGNIAADSSLRMSNDVDVAQVQASMAENCLAQFSFSRIGNEFAHSFFIQGSKSALLINDRGLFLKTKRGVEQISGENYFGFTEAMDLSCFKSFSNQIATRGKPEYTLEAALHVSMVSSAMTKSLLLKETVNLV